MANTIVAVYGNFHAANEARRELVKLGFPQEQFHLVTQQNKNINQISAARLTHAKPSAPAVEKLPDGKRAGISVGARVGAAFGVASGVLVGLGALVLPDVGPLAAANHLSLGIITAAATTLGAVIGSSAGGVLGAVIGLNIPKKELELYQVSLHRGGVMVSLQAEDDSMDLVVDHLKQHHPIDLHIQSIQRHNYSQTDDSLPLNAAYSDTQVYEHGPSEARI
jgi:hypothetical protein